MTTIDATALELLASKICHDLISPIGAVNNGIEFLEDEGPSAGKEVIDLIAFSAGQASAKLQAYRMAYGLGGADTNLRPEDVHKAIHSMIGADNKIRQEWDPHAPLGHSEYPPGFCKMLVSVLLLAVECLPKGGILSVTGQDGKIMVRAEGENAGLRSEAENALTLTTQVENLEPRYVHPFITGIMAQKYGFKIERTDKTDTTVVLQISLP